MRFIQPENGEEMTVICLLHFMGLILGLKGVDFYYLSLSILGALVCWIVAIFCMSFSVFGAWWKQWDGL